MEAGEVYRVPVSDPSTSEALFAQYVETRCQACVTELYQRHHEGAVSWAAYRYRWLGRHGAEDVVNDAWVNLMRKPRQVKNFQGWLTRIVRNEALNRLRKKQSHRETPIDGYSLPGAEPEPVESAIRSESPVEFQKVRDLIDGLSDKQREVAVGIVDHGLSISQIAERLSLDKMVVNSRWGHAKVALQRALARAERGKAA